MTQATFDYYNTSQNVVDCAKWITFIRLYAYVRTPACIYSKILTPSSKQVWRNIHAIAVPDYIANIIAECFEEISAREANLELDKLHVSDASMLKDLYIETGVVPFREFNTSFKPREMDPYRLSRASVVRLGASLITRCADSLKVSDDVMKRAVLVAVKQLSRQDLEPAALWPDEMDWLSASEVRWTGGVMYESS